MLHDIARFAPEPCALAGELDLRVMQPWREGGHRVLHTVPNAPARGSAQISAIKPILPWPSLSNAEALTRLRRGRTFTAFNGGDHVKGRRSAFQERIAEATGRQPAQGLARHARRADQGRTEGARRTKIAAPSDGGRARRVRACFGNRARLAPDRRRSGACRSGRRAHDHKRQGAQAKKRKRRQVRPQDPRGRDRQRDAPRQSACASIRQ